MKFKYGTRRRAIDYEKAIADYWKENKTFEKSIEQRDSSNSYVFYDGPPFANGLPHHGHVLGSVVKDAIPRYQTMKGKRVERRWGWDCHGLPAEKYTENQLNIADRRDIGTKIKLEDYISQCRKNVSQISDEWESTIDRIGRWVDFRGAYRTMDKDFMESVWWAFKQLYDAGKIYEGEKVLMYDTKFATPVSKNEVTMDNDAYQTVTDPSVFVKFRVKNETNISFVRHGLTDWNEEGRKQGRTDIPLNDIGKKQAEQVRNNLDGQKFDLIFVSPLKRAKETAEIINQKLNVPIIVRDEIIERNFGKFEGQVPSADDGWNDFWDVNKNLGFDGESVKDMFVRVHEFIDEIKRDYAGKSILIVAHGGVARAVRFYFEEMPKDGKLEKYCPGNCEVLKYELGEQKYLLAWTTTPWTLPANMALAVNPKMKYVEAEVDGENLILAKDLVEKVLVDEKHQPLDHKIVREMTGKDLVGIQYIPLFSEENESVISENAHKIYAADFVEDEGGTGVVHVAPAYGPDDFELAQENNIPVLHTIDDDGYYLPEFAAQLEQIGVRPTDENGIEVWAANKFIAKCLEEKGIVWKIDYIQHEYPFNPRSKQRIMYRAIPSWFFDVQGQKPLMLEQNENINWFPAHIKHGRFAKNIEAAPDWNLSRDRFWATAMPVWKGDKGSVRVVGSYDELEKLSGVKLDDYHRPWVDDVEFDLPFDGNSIRHSEFVSESKNQFRLYLGSYKPWKTGEDFSKCVEMVGENKTAVLITNAWDLFSWSEKSETTLSEMKEFLTEFGIKAERLDLREYFGRPEELAKRLERIGLIYAFGGNTFVLRRAFSQSGLDQLLPALLNEGVVYGGFSAGSCICSESLRGLETVDEPNDTPAGYDKKTIWDGLGFIDFALAPHYRSDHPESPMVEEEVKEYREKGISYQTLRDGEALIACDGKIVKILKQDDKIEHFTRIDKVLDCWFESGSMPFAQLHYPFENKEKFEKNYPADFIVEYMAQVRAWFYYVHTVNTGLAEIGAFGECGEHKNAFKNVITTGTLAGNDGRKMSKSLGNYTDPNELMDKFSADSLRFLLLSSPVLSGEDFSLTDKDVGDVARKLSMIWNMYDFFTMYAEVDGWEFDGDKLPALSPNDVANPLDKWIISRVHQLVEHVTHHMDGYNLPEACSEALPFLDDASNWYVRRSRRRFWKSEDDADKNQAYQTLHYVLVKIAQTLAPLTPFLAEELYQKLTGGESVHLLDWPEAGNIDEKVLADMKRAREIIEQGLALRMEHDEFGQIKVRQPLSKLEYNEEKLDEFYEQIITEEVNVKEVTQEPFFTGFMEGKGVQVHIHKNITPELKREGQAREIIRIIQKARKDAELNVDDRITLNLKTGDKDLQKAIDEWRETIATETLADQFAPNDGYKTTAKIDNIELEVQLKEEK